MTLNQALQKFSDLKFVDKLDPEQQIVVSCCEKGTSYSKLMNIAKVHDVEGRVHIVLYPSKKKFQDPWDVKESKS